MTQPAGQQASAAIFAAEGPARGRLVRAAVAAGIALVAAWAIALALGVLGGFDALPGLPSSHPHSSSEASSPTRRAATPAAAVVHHQQAPVEQTSRPAPASGGSNGPSTRTSPPKPAASAPTITQAPSATGQTTASIHGQGSAPVTTGKPAGSPGNGAGGSGAPGQLR